MRDENLRELRIEARGHRDAKRRVQLVDITVCRHARIGFADSGAVEQAGLAMVAGFCVDFHRA